MAVLSGEVEGEKAVTRHILEQTQRNGDDLAALKSRLDRVAGDGASSGACRSSCRSSSRCSWLGGACLCFP